MVVILKEDTTPEQKKRLKGWFEGQGLKVHESDGEFKTIFGLVGDVEKVDKDMVEMLDIVDRVTRISEPYKKANRKFHPKDTVVDIARQGAGSVTIGKGTNVIAGIKNAPSHETLLSFVEQIADCGASMLVNAVATDPRSIGSVSSGREEELIEVCHDAGILIGLEVESLPSLDAFDDADALIVASRNMQNYELLDALGQAGKPVILKRGNANTLEELLMSAERLMTSGNTDVILCENGIRTFEGYTKNTLDISAVPILNEKTHLPILVDPGEATGRARLVEPLSLSSLTAGADGVIVNVRTDRDDGPSDPGAVTLDEFRKIKKAMDEVNSALEK